MTLTLRSDKKHTVMGNIRAPLMLSILPGFKFLVHWKKVFPLPMELKQRRLFARQQLRYNDTTLFISTWTLVTGKKEWSVRLDEIAYRHEKRQMGFFSNGCLFTTGLIILSTLVIVSLPLFTTLIVLTISMTPLMLGRLMHNYNYIELNTRCGPVLIGYSGSQQEKADAFVSDLKQAIKKYLVWKYGRVDADLKPEKQIENFWWLRNNEIITDEAYEQLKAKLKESLSRTNT